MSRRSELSLFAAVFLGVAATHIWMIWMAPTALSFSPRHFHTDSAVMPLMGKHMLERGEFPIFYYGQNWMGSLAAIVHAAVFLVVGGMPPWSAHVAPLLFFVGFCLVLYLLTRDALGPAVALAALAWNVVTPVQLSEFATTPSGGYVEGLMLGTLLLWLSVRLVLAQQPWRKNGYYALLGFAAGVAWWTSPLVIYQLLASAVYVVMRDRMVAVGKGMLLSLPAFLLGAGPFFYYYARDPSSSLLDVGEGFAVSQIPTGLYLLFVERLPDYLDWDLFGLALPFTAWMAAVVYGGATLFLLWHLRKSLKANHPLSRAAILPIFFVIFVLLVAASIHIRRAAPRYALPLSAFFPVALGLWVVRSRGPWKVVAWTGCAALFVLQAWTTVSWVASSASTAESMARGVLGLVDDLEANGVKRVYVPRGSELVNFYARERITASLMTAERYRPNMDALEKDRQPAFLYSRGEENLTQTLGVLGGSSDTVPIGSLDLIRTARGPDHRYRQVSAVALHASASHVSEAMRHVSDRDMDSFWTSNEPRRPGMWVELDLGRPLMVGMMRLWNRGEHHGNYAMDVRIDTSVDGKAWHEVGKRSPTDFFYWSGPRVYPWEWGYRWEARFSPVEARFLKLTQYQDVDRAPWMIGEAYVYEDLGTRAPDRTDEQDVLRRIRELGLDRVYADRWMSARIAELSQDRIETVKPFTLAIGAFYPQLKSRVIQWGDRTGFVLEDSDADEFERLMREEDVHHLAREDWGRWVLFHLETPGSSPDAPPGDPGWWWMGLGAVKTASREKSRYLASLGRTVYLQGDAKRAVALSRRAVDAYAFNQTARRTLIDALDRLGRRAEADEEPRALREMIEPQVKVSAEFGRTLQFLGYTPDGTRARPGHDVKVRYFWKVRRDPGPKESIGIFVHLENGQARFQADFHFLGTHDRGIWPVLDDEVFSQDAWIRVPVDAPRGSYRILLGVYDVMTGRRWSVSSSEAAAPKDRVPVGVLEVEAPQAG